jgi:hypothetical protein
MNKRLVYKKKMKVREQVMKRFLIMICLLVLVTPVIAFGAQGSLEGTIQGYNCVMQGKTCPLGSEDPLVATEFTFVLLTPDNKYYFVPNIDRAVLARHVAEQVRINGDINNMNHSIKAQTIEVNRGGKWRVAYDATMNYIPAP